MPKRGLNKVQTRLKGIPTHQGPFGPENEEGKWKEALHPGQPLQQHPAAHQRPGSKAQTALWQQHLAAAPCSGTPAAAPATQLQNAHSTLTAAPCSGTLQGHQEPSSKTQTCNSAYTWSNNPNSFAIWGKKNLHEEKKSTTEL